MIYRYKTGRYIRDELNSDRGCKEYRTIPVEGKAGRKLLICVTGKKGKRGGTTKAVALLRSTKTKKGKALAKKAKIKEMR